MQPHPDAALPPPGVVFIEVHGTGVDVRTEFRLAGNGPVVVEPVPQFPGAFLARPAAPGPRPLVIVLGGSEGDDERAREVAPKLAAQGYAALGLPYRSPDRGKGPAIAGLPSLLSEIPVDRLLRVREWAAADPRVDAGRIGLWGTSKGAEFALVAAAHYDFVDAVVAIVPSDVVWEGFGSGSVERTGTASFSIDGKALPFVPYGAPGRGRSAKDAGRRMFPARAAAARIPVENFRGPLLVVGGVLDQSWDSAGMSQAIAERRAEHGRPTVVLIFPDVGHAFGGDLLDPVDAARGQPLEAVGEARKAAWIATLALYRNAWPPPD
jgi:dienelactone hydrolase